MKKQTGFTLIELIIVIIILGILAVTAAPKFLDIQSDAQASALRGVKGGLQGSSQLIYAKGAIEGKKPVAETTSGTTTKVSYGGVSVDLDFGYMDAEKMTAAKITAIADIDTNNEFTVLIGSGATTSATAIPAGTFAIYPNGLTPTAGGPVDFTQTGATGSQTSCHILYTEATAAGDSPEIVAVTGAC